MRRDICIALLVVVASAHLASAGGHISFHFNDLLSIDSCTDCSDEARERMECDIFVVGGGNGGLLAAENLARNGQDVCLFEMKDYWGGKIKDKFWPDAPNIEPAPLGGWRYDPAHQELQNILHRFEIPTQQWTSASIGGGSAGGLFEARGETMITNADAGLRVAYPNLPTEIPHPNDPNATLAVTQDALWNFISTDSDEIRKQYFDMWSYLGGRLSPEIRSFMIDGSPWPADYSLENTLTYWNFIAEDSKDVGNQRRPLKGMSTIAIHLAQSAIDNGGRLFLSERVQSVEREDDGTFTVRSGMYKVTAKKLILAVPPAELLEITGNVAKNIQASGEWQSLRGEPVMRIAALFENAWWEPELGKLLLYVTHSTCLTQVVPLKDVSADGYTTLVLSYSSGSCAITHWKKYTETDSDELLKAEVMRSLRYIFPSKEVPEPLDFAYKFWDQSWHVQQPGVFDYRFEDIALWAENPIPGWDVRIVNEAVATHRAWIEGAFRQWRRIEHHYGINEKACGFPNYENLDCCDLEGGSLTPC
eukprot:TRINITY_DN6044_c0_g1_i1.p1 TRINITY_DN6044_c0_g1~~TRINITY_DN6044_c0_g1_i1.p1  ORF type:complete len:533 (-),score=74.96 TRINITY_DN6044_c0_g1_i1:18-1616(-)